MIAKLEMILSTTQQNKDQIQKKTQTIGATLNNESTTTYTWPENAQSKLLGA